MFCFTLFRLNCLCSFLVWCLGQDMEFGTVSKLDHWHPSTLRSAKTSNRLRCNCNSQLIYISLFRRLHCKSNSLHINLFIAFILRAIISFIKSSLFVEGVGLEKDIQRVEGGDIVFIDEGLVSSFTIIMHLPSSVRWLIGIIS